MYGNIQLWIDPAKVGCPFDKDEVLRRRTACIEAFRPDEGTPKNPNPDYQMELSAYQKAVAACNEVFNSCNCIVESRLERKVHDYDLKDGQVVLTRDGLFHAQVKLHIDVCRRVLAEPVNLLADYASRVVVYCWINVDPTKETVPSCGCWGKSRELSGLMVTRSPKEFEPHRLRIEMHLQNLGEGISVSDTFFKFLSPRDRTQLLSHCQYGGWDI